MKIKSSGKTQEFKSGARRDAQDGKGRFDLIPTLALKRLAQHYESGANKYGENNWKRGMPLRRFLNSAFSHLIKCLDGRDDEDHAAAILWNICGFIYTQQAIKNGILPQELDNLNNMPIEESSQLKSKESFQLGCFLGDQSTKVQYKLDDELDGMEIV